MELEYTEMTIRLSPVNARLLGEGLIHFAETCEKKLAENDTGEVAKNVLFNDHKAGFTFIWKPIKKDGKIINLESFCTICEKDQLLK